MSTHIRALGGDGILRREDMPALTTAARRIEALMRDGRFHSATEILDVAGQREGLRRMRELRSRYRIERLRNPLNPKSREFYYRLIREEGPQQWRLF